MHFQGTGMFFDPPLFMFAPPPPLLILGEKIRHFFSPEIESQRIFFLLLPSFHQNKGGGEEGRKGRRQNALCLADSRSLYSKFDTSQGVHILWHFFLTASNENEISGDSVNDVLVIYDYLL